MNKNQIVSIGYIVNSISETGKKSGKQSESVIVLSENVPSDAFSGIEVFSHIEVDYYLRLHGTYEGNLLKAREKLFDPGSGKVASTLFGNSIVKLIKRDGRNITVKGLDAVNGTQVIDIKPVMHEISHANPNHQTVWSKKSQENC